MPNSEIALLEASLEVPPTVEGEALAARIASRLITVSVESSPSEREAAVRGLITLNHHYYRLGDLARAHHASGSACTFARPGRHCQG